jgi:broad specificity phosphatase PhoE
MPTFDLILVRHGVTDWNEQHRLMGRLPVALNERGRAQAEGVARALAALPVRDVFTSPQERAQQTATPIAAHHGLVPRSDPALAEVWLGHWQDKTFADLRDDPDVRRYVADPMHVCEAFEPATAVHARMAGFVEHLRAHHDTGGAVVLVSHGDPLRMLVAYLLGMDIGSYRRFSIDPSSVTIARLDEQLSRFLTVNWLPNGPAALPLGGKRGPEAS